jgi:methylated-DNA-[protein]-cysteine S-methyltransferase
MATTTIDTPIGPFSVVAADSAVLASGFTGNIDELVALIHPRLRDRATDSADFVPIEKATRAYFDGDLTAIDTVEVQQHTSGGFMPVAWDALRAIPGGTPLTYTQLAGRAGRPDAIRGAAQACARNAAALFVPCHRIIRTDGTLGGYRWGLPAKEWLLDHERPVV